MNDINPQPVDAAIVPRFGSIPTFMRLPYRPDPAGLDIGLIGVPWDGGTTNRAGARHGPREIRNMSSFMRKVHHVSRIAPYKLAKVADLGDAPVNPIDLMDTLGRIEKFYAKVHAAGAVPLSAGGDHLITLPIYRAIAKGRPIGMVHFDAHSDTMTAISATTNTPTARRSGARWRRACSIPSARCRSASAARSMRRMTWTSQI